MTEDKVNSLYPYSTCTLCGETKPSTRENFGTKKNGKPRSWCRACTRERTNEHAENNREQGRARARKRKERLESVGEVNEHLVYAPRLLKEQNFECYFCKKPINIKSMEIDHLRPISRGGDNSFKNLAACCALCNKSKTNKTEVEYRQWVATVLRNYR